MIKGKISQIIGPVVDLEFNEGELPAIYNAIKVNRADGSELKCSRTPARRRFNR